MERLSDDTLLEVLRWVPELPYWAACELVSQRWCALLRRSRTRVVLSHGQHTRAAFDEALCAAQRSDLPQVELRVSAVLRSDRGYGDERVPPPLWDAAVQRQLEAVVTRSVETLSVLEISGPPVRFPAPTAVLDPVLEALARAPQLMLRHLDLSWTDAASREALGRLLAAARAPEADAAEEGEAEATEPSRPLRGQGLRTLRLGGCTQLDDALLADGVGPLAPQLAELSLASCASVSAEALSQMCSVCGSLTSLDLSQVRLTRSALRRCLSHPHIARGMRSLSLAGHTGLNSNALGEALLTCEALTEFDFSASLFSDGALRGNTLASQWRGAAHLSNIRSARLSECSAFTDAGVAELCRAAGASLTSLALGGPFSPLSDAAASEIGSRCSAPLRELELPCTRLDTAGLCSLARIGSNLSRLDLSGCGLLSEDALSQLLRRTGPGCGARLHTLLLRSCDRAVTDALLAGFLPRASSLRTLDVAYCAALTDATAVLIASGRARALAELRHLDITGCHRLTTRGRQRLHPADAAHSTLRVVGLDEEEDLVDEIGLETPLEHMRMRNV